MKYQKVKDGQVVRPLMSGWKLMCCDCRLIHKIKFRIVKGQVEFMAIRDYRATAAARRAIRRKLKQ